MIKDLIKIYKIPPCIGCRNSDSSAKYSDWNYCKDPNGKAGDFTIIRRYGLDGKPFNRIMVPKFCLAIKEKKYAQKNKNNNCI